jgi:hypothetical protein
MAEINTIQDADAFKMILGLASRWKAVLPMAYKESMRTVDESLESATKDEPVLINAYDMMQVVIGSTAARLLIGAPLCMSKRNHRSSA